MNCKCADSGCPVHTGSNVCVNRATETLYRIDMEDRTGTRMCEKCASDAFDNGLFTDSPLRS